MPAARIAFTTPTTVSRWRRWLLFSPVARIVWFAVVAAIVGVVVAAGTHALGWTAKTAPEIKRALATLAEQLLPALLGYAAIVYAIERRRMRELAPGDIPRFGMSGLALGLALFSAVIGILWLASSYHVTGTNHRVDWAFGLLVAGVGAGIGEEIITRGVLFRIVEEGLGTWWALVISAAFFGAAHIANPNATAWSSIAIMIEAGLLLALLYHVTRSLWACVGLHAAWNISEGLIYGVPVSGSKADGWLAARLTGPAWLSGGAFGAEASVIAVAVCSVASMILLGIAIKRGSIIPPAWRRATLGDASAAILC